MSPALLLPLLGCKKVRYYAIGGGDVEIEMVGLEDPDDQRSWSLPGAGEARLERVGTPYNDNAPPCAGESVAWLFLVDDDPEMLLACGEGLRFQLEFTSDSVYGVTQRGREISFLFDAHLDDGRAQDWDGDFAELTLEDETTGHFEHLSVPVWIDDEHGADAHMAVTADWEMDPDTRVLISSEWGW